ncbi:MAG: hypothetical protein MO853_06625 [Candidatus Protistobacter heckmanni]|nr:hypothetical protein [Candidatus Protistobacter heckmanni]
MDYINTHAPGSVEGDLEEWASLREVFGANLPACSSVKGLTGHALGASAAQEAVYCLLMMQEGFAAGCANLANADPLMGEEALLRRSMPMAMRAALSTTFGFGGTYSALVLRCGMAAAQTPL